MDDIFNTNPSQENMTSSAHNPENTTNAAPMGTNPASGYTASQIHGTPPYSQPYNQSGYYQQPQQNAPQQQPAPQPSFPYGTPYSPYAQQSAPQYRAPKKKTKKTGKTIFAILVCICIVIASLAIGLSFTEDSSVKKPQTEYQNEQNNGDASVVSPNTEDSPISFSEYSGEGEMTPEQIYDAVKDINVGIIVYSQNQKVGEGSGIIAGEDASGKYTYIITCAHVISDRGVSIQIQFNDKKELDADIVGYDTKTDVGVLRVKGSGYKAATFGNSDKLTVGQTVYAIGNPGGTVFFGSFTHGIISAIDRPVASSTSAYDLPCIQHNAAINPGNSGGALVNAYGQVIGLNSSKITSTEYEGMGFSVPSNTMLEIYKDIVQNGYVTNRPMLGISYYAVSSDYTYSAIAWRNNLPYGSIVIAAINEESSLDDQGVRVGDIITGVNGKQLDSTDILLEAIEGSQVGDTIKLSVCRLSNNGSVSQKFEIEAELIEDKGEAASVEQEAETDPFSNYFGNGFGY